MRFKGYIYKTTNLVSGKIYIGQSIKLHKDWISWYLGSGIILNRAINSIGREYFKKEIIEWIETCQDDLDSREKYWIKFYNSQDKSIGYNIREGGVGVVQWLKKVKLN